MTRNSMTRDERRTVGCAAGLLGLRMLGLFMVLPLFSLYVSGMQGATPLLVGLALGIYGLSQALLQIPLGRLSDRVGRRQIIVAGLGVFVVGSVVAAMADSIWMLLLGRLLQGAGAIASTVLATVADVTRMDQRTKAMAMTGMGMGLSFVLAIVLGPVLAPAIGLQGIFVLAAVLGVVSMGLAWMLPDSRPVAQTKGAPASVRLALVDGACVPWNVSIFLLHLMLTACFIALPLLLRDQFELPVAQHAWVYLSAMLASFCVAVPVMVIGERRGYEVAARRGAVFAIALGAAGLVAAEQLAAAWFGLFLFFGGFNMLEAALPSGVSKRTPFAGRGLAMGVFASHQFMGAFCGGLFGGWLLGFGGSGFVLSCIAAAAMAWFVLGWVIGKRWSSDRYVLQLPEAAERPPWQEKLGRLPGVEQIEMIEEEGTVYLSVDRKRFDPRDLWAFGSGAGKLSASGT